MSHSEPPAPFVGLFIHLADTIGDGTGEADAKGDYSTETGTPTGFKIVAQPGEELIVWRVIVHIEDTGAMKADGYGGLVKLPKGVLVRKLDASGDVYHDLLDNHAVKTNSDWGHQMFNVNHLAFGAGTVETIYANWNLKDSGAPIILYEGEALEFFCQDDLTGLEDHHFSVQGQRNAVVV